ncbi:MAG: uridine kinase [Myxococcales bacterium]|jgi:uridine kinase|nr:uridine kinase [Myxococcales bacterium]
MTRWITPGESAPRPYFVGVVGGTGSGKTTIAKRLRDALPEGSVAMLQHDAYYKHRPELSLEERDQLNFDHPDSLDNELLRKHLGELRAGRPIEAPQYDFASHLRLAETRRVEPAPVIVVEGILLFVDQELRDCFDAKIYVDTDADIRILRRIERDLQRRGRTFEQVREQYFATVRPMHLQFVEPSKRWADVIIPEGGHNRVALDLIVSKLEALLAVHRR